MSQAGVQELKNSVIELLKCFSTQRGTMSLMITGGRGAAQIYKKWQENDIFSNALKPLDLFLTDERLVPQSHSDSNYRLVKRVLFPDELPQAVVFHCMCQGDKSPQADIEHYERLLPDSLDMLLLSMGEDGHIASLFPNSPGLFEAERKVVPTVGTKAPFQRLTITPPVIQSAKKVYVLAIGDEKRRKYEEALLDPEDISSIPARLVLDRTWIFELDEETDLCLKY